MKQLSALVRFGWLTVIVFIIISTRFLAWQCVDKIIYFLIWFIHSKTVVDLLFLKSLSVKRVISKIHYSQIWKIHFLNFRNVWISNLLIKLPARHIYVFSHESLEKVLGVPNKTIIYQLGSSHKSSNVKISNNESFCGRFWLY